MLHCDESLEGLTPIFLLTKKKYTAYVVNEGGEQRVDKGTCLRPRTATREDHLGVIGGTERLGGLLMTLGEMEKTLGEMEGLLETIGGLRGRLATKDKELAAANKKYRDLLDLVGMWSV